MCVRFCREVHGGCLPHDKNDSDKTAYKLQLTSAWVRSWGTAFPVFSLFYTIKKRVFSANIYRASGSVSEVSNLCHLSVRV